MKHCANGDAQQIANIQAEASETITIADGMQPAQPVGMSKSSDRELKVWQRAVDLVTRVRNDVPRSRRGEMRPRKARARQQHKR
jgi:hypothetical protein